MLCTLNVTIFLKMIFVPCFCEICVALMYAEKRCKHL